MSRVSPDWVRRGRRGPLAAPEAVSVTARKAVNGQVKLRFMATDKGSPDSLGQWLQRALRAPVASGGTDGREKERAQSRRYTPGDLVAEAAVRYRAESRDLCAATRIHVGRAASGSAEEEWAIWGVAWHSRTPLPLWRRQEVSP